MPMQSVGPPSSWYTTMIMMAGVAASFWLRERYWFFALVAGLFGTVLAGRVFDELRAKAKRSS